MAASPMRSPEFPPAPWYFLHVSNLLTYTLVLSGMLSVVGAERGLRWRAGAGLAAASLLDLFDGAFAGTFQRTPVQKRFGVQIDSLSDGFAFGAVPIVCCMSFLGEKLSFLYLLASCVYLLGALTRLGYYNLQIEERGGFVGIPTTLMGLLWSAFFCFPFDVLASAVLLLAGGVLMIAPIRVARPRRPLFYSLVALALILLSWHISRGFLAQPQ